MLPSIFGESLFDDFFADPFEMMAVPQGRNPLYGKHAKNMMKTDIRETENNFELDVYKRQSAACMTARWMTISRLRRCNKFQTAKPPDESPVVSL